MTNTIKNEKMTYVKALSAAVACEALSEEVREKLSVLLNQQVKRNATEQNPEKIEQNVALQSMVMQALAASDHPMTVTEILASNPDFMAKSVSNQRCSSLLRDLISDEKVKKTVEKRKAYFALA